MCTPVQEQRGAILTFALEVAGGDPDLFVSNVTMPSLTDYVWRLPSASGRRRLVIAPHDVHYTVGSYYVGIYALTRASWTLTATIYAGEDGAAAFNTAKVDALMRKFTTLMVDDPSGHELSASMRGKSTPGDSDGSESDENDVHTEASLAHERRMTVSDRSRLQLLRTDSKRRLLSDDATGGGGGSARGDGSPVSGAGSPGPKMFKPSPRLGASALGASARALSGGTPQPPAVNPEGRAFLQRNMSEMGILEDALYGGNAGLRGAASRAESGAGDDDANSAWAGGAGGGAGGDDDEGADDDDDAKSVDMELLEAEDRRAALEAAARRLRAATALASPVPAKYTLTGIRSVKGFGRAGATSALEGAPTQMVKPPRGVTLRKRPRRRRRAGGKTALTKAILSASAPVLPRVASVQ